MNLYSDRGDAPVRRYNTYSRCESVIPVTCSVVNNDIVSDGGSGYSLGGSIVSHVRIVGAVLKLHNTENHFALTLDDGTAEVDVSYHIDGFDAGTPSNEQWKTMRTCRVHTYVRVIAVVEAVGGTVARVSAVRVVPLVDLNELTMHIADCLLHIQQTRPSVQRAAPAYMMTHNTPTAQPQQQARQAGHQPYRYQQPPQQQQRAPISSLIAPFASTNPVSKDTDSRNVLHVIRNAHSTHECGIHTNEIHSKFPHRALSEIQAIVTFWSEEGAIYTGGDEDTWKIT